MDEIDLISSKKNGKMIVYGTVNLINNKWYVGQDSHDNPKYLGSGTLLTKAVKKYGRDNFKKFVLGRYDTFKELNKAEIMWIEISKEFSKELSYNLTIGGNGGSMLPEVRKRISNSLKGIKHSEQRKINISNSLKGRKASGEFKKKVSDGIRNSDKYKLSRKKLSKSMKGELNHMYGKHLSEDTKRKLSFANLGKKREPFTEETKKKMSEAGKQKYIIV